MKRIILLLLSAVLFVNAAMSQTYNEHDKSKLRAFLAQASAQSGKINAVVCGLTVADTLTWKTSEAWVARLFGLEWSAGNAQTPKRLTTMRCFSTSGKLDVNGCTALKELICAGNGNTITSIDVGGCTSLEKLNCESNRLTDLFVGGCTSLKELTCQDNQIATLNITECLALITLDCHGNRLTVLDVGGRKSLTSLACNNNQLTGLNVNGSTALTSLICNYNNLTSLDVTSCTKLTELRCGDNRWSTLDLRNNTSLTILNCSRTINSNFTGLSSLNITGCTKLTELNCYYNYLTTLDLTGCTSLKSVICNSNQLTSLNLTGNKSLTELNCRYNTLTTMSISGCTSLKSVICNNNQLTELDLGGCSSLETLTCNDNQLKVLSGVNGKSKLTKLLCYTNQIFTLDVSGGTSLTELNCSSNRITALDVSRCTALTSLNCNANRLSSLNVSGSPKLISLYCDGGQLSNQLTTLNVSNNIELERLECRNNLLTTLDVGRNLWLKYLYCEGNPLTSMTVGWKLVPVLGGLGLPDATTKAKATLRVPVGTLAIYKASTTWNGFGTIVESSGAVVPPQPTAVTIEPSSASMSVGSSLQLSATVYPSDAIDKSVTWSSSDASVVSVINGLLVSHKAGAAVITVTTVVGGHRAECLVTVGVPSTDPILPTSVHLDLSSSAFSVGATMRLVATVIPSDASDKRVLWSTSDASVASVVDGLVTAHKVGVAVITVTTLVGGHVAECWLSVVSSSDPAPPLPPVPSSVYDSHDLSFLRTFLSLPSSVVGKLNGELLGLSKSDMSTWTTTDDWVEKLAGVTWDDSSPRRIKKIEWDGRGLGGYLDVSGLEGLQVLECAENGLVGIDISVTPSLVELWCYSNPLRDITVDWAIPKSTNALGSSRDEWLLRHISYVATATLHVPVGTLGLYRSAEGWRLFYSITEDSYVANTNVARPSVSVSVDANTLTINSPASEVITLYSPTGVTLLQTPKAKGITTIALSRLPRGVILVSGSSGWVRKILR